MGSVQVIDELRKISTDKEVSSRDKIAALAAIARIERQQAGDTGGALLDMSREDIHAEIARTQALISEQATEKVEPVTPLRRERKPAAKPKAPAKKRASARKVRLTPGKDRPG